MVADAPLSTKNRKAKRDSLFLTASLRIEGAAAPIVTRVRNLSNGGMMIDGNAALEIGQEVETELRGIGTVSGKVAWVEAGRAGIAFEGTVDPRLARYVPPTSMAPVLVLPKVYGRRPGLRTRG